METVFLAPEEIVFEIISETPLGNVFSAPEEIIFEIISETPLGNVFLSAPEEVIFGISSEIRWKMISLLHQRKLFLEYFQKSAGGLFSLCVRGNYFGIN